MRVTTMWIEQRVTPRLDRGVSHSLVGRLPAGGVGISVLLAVVPNHTCSAFLELLVPSSLASLQCFWL